MEENLLEKDRKIEKKSDSKKLEEIINYFNYIIIIITIFEKIPCLRSDDTILIGNDLPFRQSISPLRTDQSLLHSTENSMEHKNFCHACENGARRK